MRLILMYFSPSRTTKRVVDTIGEVFSEKMKIQSETVDLTKSSERDCRYVFSKEDVVVFGIPVYSGRIPPVVLPVFQRIQGNGAKAVAVAVYGNCNLGDALLETADALTSCGLQVCAAAEAIGEHSYTEKVAYNRPDAEDLRQCKLFAERAYQNVSEGISVSESLPGKFPYKPYGASLTSAHTAPLVNTDLCTNCKVCVQVCPMDTIGAGLEDLGQCISCAACVKLCPNHARYFAEPSIVAAQTKLAEKFSERREPKFYL